MRVERGGQGSQAHHTPASLGPRLPPFTPSCAQHTRTPATLPSLGWQREASLLTRCAGVGRHGWLCGGRLLSRG